MNKINKILFWIVLPFGTQIVHLEMILVILIQQFDGLVHGISVQGFGASTGEAHRYNIICTMNKKI